MDEFNKLLRAMTLEFFGTGSRKITPEKLFQSDDAVFLDVRSKEKTNQFLRRYIIRLPLYKFALMRFPIESPRYLEIRWSEFSVHRMYGRALSMLIFEWMVIQMCVSR